MTAQQLDIYGAPRVEYIEQVMHRTTYPEDPVQQDPIDPILSSPLVPAFDGSGIRLGSHYYFGDISFDDLIDPLVKYRLKREHLRPGLYKTYVSRDTIFRVPACPARTPPIWIARLPPEQRAAVLRSWRDHRAEELRERTEEERDAYLERKAQENLSRAKSKLKKIVAMNDYKYFVTLTFADDRVDAMDVAKVIEKVQNWLTNMVQKCGLRYVLVPEYHPSSGRIHCHALCSDLIVQDSGTRMVRGFNRPVRLDTYNEMVQQRRIDPARCRILRTVYNIPAWRYGFSTAIPTYGSPVALAHYMIKYITKNTDRIFGKYYWCSKNQKLHPDVELRDVGIDTYYSSRGKMYGPAGHEIKIEDHVAISIDAKPTRRECKMLDQIQMILDVEGECTDVSL